MLLATAYLARMGLEPLCRAAIIIVLLTIPIGVFLTVLTLVEADFSRLWPVLTQGVGKVLKGGVLALGQVEQLSAFFVLFPFLTSPDKSWRAGSLALVSVIGFLWMTSVSAQLIFDIPLLVSLRIPALMAIQSVELPLLFLERLSSVYMATWIAQAFVTIALTL